MLLPVPRGAYDYWGCFNGHPPLGVNATTRPVRRRRPIAPLFQRAPTLGGECYWCLCRPTARLAKRFNGHPPLGVNATAEVIAAALQEVLFQRAPTLGGECYYKLQGQENHAGFLFQRAPTLGGECYEYDETDDGGVSDEVSTGTHPWG